MWVHRGAADRLAELRQSATFDKWNLPQFRLVGVNVRDDERRFTAALDWAGCVLRDGGVVAVAGVDAEDAYNGGGYTFDVRWAIKRYLATGGGSARSLRPMTLVGHRLFLASSDAWKDRLIEYIVNNQQHHRMTSRSAAEWGAFGSSYHVVESM